MQNLFAGTASTEYPRHGLRLSAGLGLLSLLICAAVLTTATYAWFSLSPDTNVEPMEGSVGEGDMNLLIAGSEGGDYDIKTKITMLNNCEELQPVSTEDLQKFYTALARDHDDKVITYKEVTEQELDKMLMHGEVYVKAEYADGDLYFSRTKLSFEGSGQLLASLRLGMIVTSGGEENTYIFSLDDVAAVGGEAKDTTGQGESVVSGVSGDGSPSYAADPQESMKTYSADDEGEDPEPKAGEKALCSLTKNQPAHIELFIYMEGCDENTVNAAQASELSMNLAFTGVQAEDKK